ncbi:MAG: DUF2231 domain-containing protein [Bacteroidetes bacterium]|nr:DUF2231 domain-containing protein [Bacteroidota bacterium]
MMSVTHLHPLSVHFPIALIIVGFFAEIAFLIFKKQSYLFDLGFYLLIIGTISATLALFTGAMFTSEMKGIAGEIQETHELLAWITISILVFTSLLRIFLKAKNNNNYRLKWLVFFLYLLAAVFIGLTGYYGGTLVYNYMMPL